MSVVEDIFKSLQSKLGKEAPLAVSTCRKVHDYLGMTIDYNKEKYMTILG
jgi:hypothetical protein